MASQWKAAEILILKVEAVPIPTPRIWRGDVGWMCVALIAHLCRPLAA